MKKFFLMISAFMIIISLSANVLEVSADGSKPYLTIQSAINASNNADIVRVYPGIYRENINFNGHSIILQSLYTDTQDSSYIHNTQIIGQTNLSAITVENNQGVTIDGFTIMNNEAQIEKYYWVYGGGINILNSNAVIKNNIITKCLAGFCGGGISISINATVNNPLIFLENNQIFNNKSYEVGGGIIIYFRANVVFSSEHRNSIYNNSATSGKDIYSWTNFFDVNILLKKGTLDLDTFDQFFITVNNTSFNNPGSVIVDIEQGLLTEVNHDLYVAPWGQDTNNGLSAESPLRTIDYATRIIASDSLNQKTIYLAPGVYSRSLNNQNYPAFLKSNTFLKGAGMTETILDDENVAICLNAQSTSRLKTNKYVRIEDLTIRNCGGEDYENVSCGPLDALAKSVTLNNILIENNKIALSNGVTASYFNIANIKNIIIRNGISTSNCYGLFVYDGKKLILENYIIDSLVTTHPQNGIVGVYINNNEEVIVNNLSISNCSAFMPTLFQFFNYPGYVPEEFHDSYFNNILICNNNTSPGDWDNPKVGFLDELNGIHLSNFTIANNRGSSYALSFGSSNIEANNMILYNPEMPYELVLGCLENPYISCTINNSYILDRANKIKYWNNNQSYLTMNEMVDAPSPIFLGMNSDSLTMAMPAYYQLAEGSPCIDTGTLDISSYNMSLQDLCGNQRVWNDRIDLGCYEYGAPSVGNENQEIIKPQNYHLKNYPNPIYVSNSSFTNISFDYYEKAKSEPEIEIFNIKGQKVRSLKTGESFFDLAQKAGLSKDNPIFKNGRNYSVIWDLKDDHNKMPASGIYFYRAKVDGRIIQTKKLLILK